MLTFRLGYLSIDLFSIELKRVFGQVLPPTPSPQNKNKMDGWRWAMVGVAFSFRRKYTLILEEQARWLLGFPYCGPSFFVFLSDRGPHARLTVENESQNENLQLIWKGHWKEVAPRSAEISGRLRFPMEVQGLGPVLAFPKLYIIIARNAKENVHLKGTPGPRRTDIHAKIIPNVIHRSS